LFIFHLSHHVLDNEACFVIFYSKVGHYHNGHRIVQSVVSFGVILTLSIISVKRNVSVSDVSSSDKEMI